MSSPDTSLGSEDFNLAYDCSPSPHNSDNSPLTDTPTPNDTTPTELNSHPLNATVDSACEEPHESSTEKPQPDPFDLLTEAIQAADDPPAPDNKVYSTTFPIARVKTIMRTDPDTSLLQSDAVFLMGEAAKLFLTRFSRDVQRITAANKRKTVSRVDVDTCLNRYHEYEFLDEQLDW